MQINLLLTPSVTLRSLRRFDCYVLKPVPPRSGNFATSYVHVHCRRGGNLALWPDIHKSNTMCEAQLAVGLILNRGLRERPDANIPVRVRMGGRRGHIVLPRDGSMRAPSEGAQSYADE